MKTQSLPPVSRPQTGIEGTHYDIEETKVVLL